MGYYNPSDWHGISRVNPLKKLGWTNPLTKLVCNPHWLVGYIYHHNPTVIGLSEPPTLREANLGTYPQLFVAQWPLGLFGDWLFCWWHVERRQAWMVRSGSNRWAGKCDSWGSGQICGQSSWPSRRRDLWRIDRRDQNMKDFGVWNLVYLRLVMAGIMEIHRLTEHFQSLGWWPLSRTPEHPASIVDGANQ